MMRLLVVTCLAYVAVALSFRAKLDVEWAAFKTSYNKQYMQEEEVLRRQQWEQNLQYIKHHNMEADAGKHGYWLGENSFADMTAVEVTAVMTGYSDSARAFTKCGHYTGSSSGGPARLPDTVDWRDKGYVTPVKNQGQCASDWAMSTTGALEGQHFRRTGRLVSLSEQNLMDCATAKGDLGCYGGVVDLAIAYVINNGGIDTEASYPYKPLYNVAPCKFNRQTIGATATGCLDIKQTSEAELQKAVAMEGPISVAIDSSHQSFQFYTHGVYKEPACSSSRLCHAVLAAGYGRENGTDYWLVKNSWGWQWGDHGYIKMARNDNNMCGIATRASFPIV